MRSAARVTLLAVLVALVASAAHAQPPDPPLTGPVVLKVGDKMPDFKLKASDDKEYTLAQYAGKSAIALCWFPRAGSGGAKNQCAGLQAVLGQIPADKVAVFGCSTASLDLTKSFVQQGKYGFPVLSDVDATLARGLGCLKPDGSGSERWTYLIDDKGVILAINKNITPPTQGTDLLAMLAAAKLLPATTTAGTTVATTGPVVLKPGDAMPAFTLKGSDDKDYTLAQYAGKSYLALCWFPRAGSGGATRQCNALMAQWPAISGYNVQVLGCSTAPLGVTKSFAQNNKFSFPVLSDADGSVAWAVGSFRADMGISERWTFLVGLDGKVVAINKSVAPDTQGTELVKMLQDNKVPAAATQ